MVDSLGWVNAVAGAPEYTGRMLRQLNAVGFAGATAARPLGARSGVRPGTSATTVTASSTVWTCQAFAGLLDGQVAGEAGPYPFAFDAVATGPVAAADGSNPRIDIIYVDVDDPSEDASAVPAVTRKYLAGVAAASPVAPSAPAGCMTVAQINVPKSGAGSPTVTWVAPYIAAAGGVQDFNTKAQLDAWLTAPLGQKARVLADGTEYVWPGSAPWKAASASPRIIPSAATNGSVDANGVVTSTAQSLVRVRDAFPAGFRVYRVTFDVTMSAAVGVLMRLAVGATDAATGYDYQRTSSISTTVSTVQDLNQTSGSLSPVGAIARHFGQFLITDPNIAGPTYYKASSSVAPTSAMTSSTGETSVAGLHRTATAYDSLTMFGGAGTITVNRLSIEGVS